MSKKSIGVLFAITLIALAGCGDKPKANIPPSGQNEWLEPTTENCKKAKSITEQFAEAVAVGYQVPNQSVNLIRIDCDGPMKLVVVDTAKGPKKCMLPGIIWFKTGEFVASNYFKVGSGYTEGINHLACNW